MRILIVDDNPLVLKALQTIFQAEPEFAVCGQATNGRIAVDEAKRLQPDAIILDLSMPVMNGLEAAAVLNKIMPSVPLVLFTLHAGAVTESEAHSAGIRLVVSKMEAGSLVGRVRTLLGAA